jgi:hypothetical protein
MLLMRRLWSILRAAGRFCGSDRLGADGASLG